jgi:hypothetical protein
MLTYLNAKFSPLTLEHRTKQHLSDSVLTYLNAKFSPFNTASAIVTTCASNH